MLLSKSPEHSSINYCNHREKNKTSQTYCYITVAFRDKIIDFKDEPEKTLLDNGDNYDWKQILMGILNLLFLKQFYVYIVSDF